MAKLQKDFSFSAERQVAWGTQIATTPVGLPTEELTIQIEPNTHRFQRARGVRGNHEADSWQNTVGKIPTASTTVIMTPVLSTLLLPGILQAGTDWADDAGVWEAYSLEASGDLPTPKGDDSGYYYTLIRNSSVAGFDDSIKDAVMTNMTLSIDPVDNDSLLMAACEFVGTAKTVGQTLTAPTQTEITTPYSWAGITAVSWDGDSILTDFMGCEISISNGMKLQGDIPTGEAICMGWEVSVKIKMMADDFSEGMKAETLSNAINDAKPFVLTFGTAAPAAAGDLTITVNGLLNAYTTDYTDGEVIEFTLDGMFTSAGDDMINITWYEA